MSLTATPQSKLLLEKMRYAQGKQETAADNMARAGVAGEKTKEIEPFKKALMRTTQNASMHTTNSFHMAGSVKEASFKSKIAKEQGSPSLTGNSISPEEQLLKLNEASTEFFRLERLHQSEKNRIKAVLGIGSGK